MSILKKFQASFHDDWCKECYTKMDEVERNLYMLPMYVGHYVSHKDVTYYKKNLCKVERKKDIPTGVYACGIIKYRCPHCCHRMVKLSIFLPVRDQEKYEDFIYFENGELDDFFL